MDAETNPSAKLANPSRVVEVKVPLLLMFPAVYKPLNNASEFGNMVRSPLRPKS